MSTDDAKHHMFLCFYCITVQMESNYIVRIDKMPFC